MLYIRVCVRTYRIKYGRHPRGVCALLYRFLERDTMLNEHVFSGRSQGVCDSILQRNTHAPGFCGQQAQCVCVIIITK